MNANSILYATDFSPASDEALAFASSLASQADATLHIVHVGDEPLAHTPVDGRCGLFLDTQAAKEIAASHRQQLQMVRPTIDSVVCVHNYLEGDPAEEILRYATDQSVDMIVVGSHGRTGWLRMLMGSVAEELVRRAPAPVLVVKHPAVSGDRSP